MKAKNIGIYEVSTNTLSCEPLLERAKNGELVCVCQQDGITEPSKDNRVYVFHSKDNGKSWSGRTNIYKEDGNAVYATELMVNDNEMSAFVVTHSGGFLDTKSLVLKSFDNGYTWENFGSTPHLSEYTFVRGALKTKNNQIIIPYHYFPITEEEKERVLNNSCETQRNIALTKTPTCETGVLISSDNGKTYKKYTACVISMEEKGWSWAEPTIAELSDNKIAMLMRNECTGWLYRCDSNDGGKTWGEFYMTDIPNPSNKPKLINLEGGKIALIHTPNNVLNEQGYGKRYPYEMWISEDDMKTWNVKIRLTDFPGEYSYTDGFYENGHVYFVVEHNRHTVLFFDVELEY